MWLSTLQPICVTWKYIMRWLFKMPYFLRDIHQYPIRVDLPMGILCTPCLFDYFLAIYLTHSKRRDLAQNLRGGMNFELKWRQLLQSKLVNIAKNCLLQKIVPFLRGKLVGAPLKMMTTCHDVTQHTNLWRRAAHQSGS